MNWSPPRAIEMAKPATLPALNARMRNRLELDHRRRRPSLDRDEGGQQRQAPDHQRQHERAGPAHRVVSVGLNPVGDADQHGAEADGEADVAPPVDPGAPPLANLTQLPVGPGGAVEADRHVDPENRTPVDAGEDAAGDESDEHAAESGHLVGAERQAALLVREGVGEYRGGVGLEHRAADGLQQPPADQPIGAVTAAEGIERQQHRGDREDEEAGVVDPHTAEHVAASPDGDDQYRLHQAVPHDHPQQIGDVARREWIETDAVEDRGHRDQDDRAVELRHEHRRGGVRQCDPLVVVGSAARRRAGSRHQRLSAKRSSSGAVASS